MWSWYVALRQRVREWVCRRYGHDARVIHFDTSFNAVTLCARCRCRLHKGPKAARVI